MSAPIVQSKEIVTLLGAASVSDALLSESLSLSQKLIAADGGAARALGYGVMPDAVIGDFDSFEDGLRARIPAERLHDAPDQNRTDFDKALSSISAPLVLAVGFTGQRLDHELAVYNATVRSEGSPTIVIGEVDIAFHARTEVNLKLPIGTRMSLFPFADVEMGSSGLKWPTGGLQFAPAGRVGTSNETVSEQVQLRPSGAGMLVIVPRTVLGEVINALVDWRFARGR